MVNPHRYERYSDVTQIFLNYRAVDEPFGVAMLDEALSGKFGDDAVFLASKSIPLGSAWESEMFRAVTASAALLVVMGRNWLNASDDAGRRRLDDPADFVRREIITAFEQGKQVIPVRLAVKRLTAADLPPELRPLLDKQDIEVRFRSHRLDVELLVQKLRQQIPALRTAASVAGKADPGSKFSVNAKTIETQISAGTVNMGDFYASGTRHD
jgi:hypothetical protein